MKASAAQRAEPERVGELERPQFEELPPSLCAQFDQVRLDRDGQLSRLWQHTPAPSTPVERLANPYYWIAFVENFRFPDEIRCVPADKSWIADVLVLSTFGEGCEVLVFRHGRLPETSFLSARRPEGLNVEDYEFRNLGHVYPKPWAVYRKPDATGQAKEMKRDLASDRECQQWLDEYLRTIERTPRRGP
jgi:hypothetical protein